MASTSAAVTAKTAATRASKRLRPLRLIRSSFQLVWSWSKLLAAHSSGVPRLTIGGMTASSCATPARNPCRCQAVASPPATPSLQRRLRLRRLRSHTTKVNTITSVIKAKLMAPAGSPLDCQVSRMPAERLGMPSSCTAPSSLTTSMPMRATPAPIAGSAMGKATRRKADQGPTPRLRHASS